jgi:hypothetical protein
MAAIYQADIWCDGCAEQIKNDIFDSDPDRAKFDDREEWEVAVGFDDECNYDSDDYPKYCSDDEESDCPQHCAAGADCVDPAVTSDGTKYGYFFGNSLTSDGDDYVVEAVNEDLRAGHNGSVACEIWADCYNYLDYVECRDRWECPFCDNSAEITDYADYGVIGQPYCADCDCEMDAVD